MALVVFDRVKESSNTTGTTTFVLDGAQTGYQSFAVVGNANTTYYTIAGQTTGQWEVGIGTYYLNNVSLARTIRVILRLLAQQSLLLVVLMLR